LSRFILDASAKLPWLFEDEATPATEALLDHVTLHGAVVPALWFLECANALATAERRGRIDASRIAQNVGLLHRRPVEVDANAPARGLGAVLDLARQFRLATYDAGGSCAAAGVAARAAAPSGRTGRCMGGAFCEAVAGVVFPVSRVLAALRSRKRVSGSAAP